MYMEVLNFDELGRAIGLEGSKLKVIIDILNDYYGFNPYEMNCYFPYVETSIAGESVNGIDRIMLSTELKPISPVECFAVGKMRYVRLRDIY